MAHGRGKIRLKKATGVALFALVGCGAPTDGEGDLVPREWEWGASYPGNGDQELHDGPTVNEPDSLIWTIMDSHVFDGQDPDQLVFAQDDVAKAIVDGDGNVLCTMTCMPSTESYLHEGVDGPVLLTQWGRFIFDGEVVVPEVGTPEYKALIATRIYEFADDQVFFGPAWKKDVALTSTGLVQQAEPLRKLTIASLIHAVCGGPGLPPA